MLTLTQICQVLFNINIGVRIKITHAIAPVNLHSSNGITGVSECLSDFDVLGQKYCNSEQHYRPQGIQFVVSTTLYPRLVSVSVSMHTVKWAGYFSVELLRQILFIK